MSVTRGVPQIVYVLVERSGSGARPLIFGKRMHCERAARACREADRLEGPRGVWYEIHRYAHNRRVYP